MNRAELAESLKGVAWCGSTEAACVCGEPLGHDGPHVCSDHERCNGSWWYADEGEFRVERMPATWDATLNWLLGGGE